MKTRIISLAAIIVALSNPATASHASHSRNHQNYFYDYGKVTQVTPIIETVEQRIPSQCNHRPRNHHSHKSHNHDTKASTTPIILGTIIGAAIGNELGHNKSNKRVGAVAGGLLGGSIGADIGRQRRSDQSRHEIQTHNRQYCDESHYSVHYREHVVGYRVNYRYRGHTYHTETSEHPGKRIRIKLSIEPLVS